MALSFDQLGPEAVALSLRAALDHTFNPTLITSASLSESGPHIIYANKAFCQMTGYAYDELIGQSPRILQGPDTDQSVIARLRTAIEEGTYFWGAAVNYRKDGSSYEVEWSVSPVRDDQGQIVSFVSFQQDVTSRNRSQRELKILAGALDCADDAIFITDSHRKIIFVNRSFEKLTGYSAEDARGRLPDFLVVKDEQSDNRMMEALSGREPYHAIVSNRHKDGSEFFVHQSISPVNLDSLNEPYFVCISKDVTQRVLERRELEEMAVQDELTGVFNRRGGENMLGAILNESHHTENPVVVALADIDHFKKFNDQFGHLAGDQVLTSVAERLKECLRENDLVARWGGEEFLIVLPGASLKAGIRLLERLRLEVQSVRLENLPAVTASFGVVEYRSKESSTEVIDRADRALYLAKSMGRNRVCSINT